MKRQLSEIQEYNVTRLIKALISGDYKSGLSYKMYDPQEGTHTVLGVVAREWGFPEQNGVFFFGQAADEGRIPYNSYNLPVQWFAHTFGVGYPGRLSQKSDGGWTFPELAAYLVSFLSESDEKSALQNDIRLALRHESNRRQEVADQVNELLSSL